MERLTDIWNNIKGRVSNPLVFSFILSWTFFNWEIVTALIWYDPSQIKNEGAISIFQFIQSKLNPNDSLWNPFGFAVLYTLASPIIKNLIGAFNAWASKWGTDWSLKISKGGKVGVEKYLKLRSEYEKRTQILEDAITKESSSIDKFNTLTTELLQTRDQINDLKRRESELTERLTKQINVRIMHGFWTVQYMNSSKSATGEDEVFINEGGNYFLLKDFGERDHAFNLNNFFHDISSRAIFFVKEDVKIGDPINASTGQFKYNVTRLTYEREDLLTGHENGTTRIEYRRKITAPNNVFMPAAGEVLN